MPRPPFLRAIARAPLALLVALALATPNAARAGDIDGELLAGLEFRSIGPATMSGRIAAVAALPHDPRVIYVGAATGGVWRTRNGGLNWTPIFEHQDAHAVGAVAIAPSAPDDIWVGTGEGNPRNSASVGNGIYRSVDGGKTWKHLGLERTERIHRICLHPTDPNVAYVAALGPTWSDGGQRGVFRTLDGGDTWECVLSANERTGCADLVIDPTNPRKLIAALWEYRRWPWFFESGGPGSGIFVTHDGGDNWVERTSSDGLPKGDLGRIGLAIAPSKPQVVYAYVEAKKNAIYRSNDGGATFRRVGSGDNIGNRPFYYADLHVDTQNPNRVYSLWSMVSVSNDGGKTFDILVPYSGSHPDHHALWIHPTRPEYLINGNDGGIAISQDHGRTWRFVRNLPLAQFYHVRVDDQTPYQVYGGLQDNGSWVGPSTVWTGGGIRNFHWQELNFGDGFDTAPHPRDPMIGYAMSQEGYLVRWNRRTGEGKSIRPVGPKGAKLRFNWNAALALHPTEPDTLLFGSQFVHRSRNRGDSWETISPDLTTNNPEWQKQRESGGLTPDVTGAENFTSLVSIAVSPVASQTIWTGSDDGRIHVTTDDGRTWRSVEDNLRGVPENTWVAQVVPSAHDARTAYAVLDDHRRGNWDAYLFRTSDGGESWVNIAGRPGAGGIRGYALCMAEDPIDPELLFCGTEFGLWVSWNGGRDWLRWKHGLPYCSIKDLAIQPRTGDLIAASHGRGVFILDDLTPLRELDDAHAESTFHLYAVADAQQYWVGRSASSRFPGNDEYRGRSRRYGALISFMVNNPDLPHPDEATERRRREQNADAAKRDSGADEKGKKEKKKPLPKKVKVEIYDAAGERIRRFERDAKQGLNRITWNLRRKGARRAGQRRGNEPQGYEVTPGRYTVKVHYGETSASQEFRVLADPRRLVSEQEREDRARTMERVYRLREALSDTLDRLSTAKSDLDRAIAKAKKRQADEKKAKGEEKESDDEQGADENTEREKKSDEAEPEETKSDDDTSEEATTDGAKKAEAEAEADPDADKTPLELLLRDAKKAEEKRAKLVERIRGKRGTKGITDDPNVQSALSQAQWMMSSSWDAPTPTQLERLARAEEELRVVVADVNAFFATEWPALRARIAATEVRLFDDVEPVDLPPRTQEF